MIRLHPVSSRVGQWKPNNQNQSECKLEEKSKWRKNTTLIVGNSMVSGIDQQHLSIKGRIVKVRSFPWATICMTTLNLCLKEPLIMSSYMLVPTTHQIAHQVLL